MEGVCSSNVVWQGLQAPLLNFVFRCRATSALPFMPVEGLVGSCNDLPQSKPTNTELLAWLASKAFTVLQKLQMLRCLTTGHYRLKIHDVMPNGPLRRDHTKQGSTPRDKRIGTASHVLIGLFIGRQSGRWTRMKIFFAQPCERQRHEILAWRRSSPRDQLVAHLSRRQDSTRILAAKSVLHQ